MARQRLPDKIKKMRGTDQECRLSGDESVPVANITSIGKPPTWMTTNAKRVYKELGGTLVKSGVLLNEANMYMFAMLCQEMGKYIELQRDLKKEGMVITMYHIDQETGEVDKDVIVSVKTNPKVKISDNTFNHVRLMANEFGLTPSGLSRIAANLSGNSQDEYEAFLNS